MNELTPCIYDDVITHLIQYDEPRYEGFITEEFAAPDFNKDSPIPHDPYRCLECSVALNKSHHQSQTNISVSTENLVYGNQLGTAGSSTTSLSPVNISRSQTSESSAVSSNDSSNTTLSQSSTREGSGEADAAGKLDNTHAIILERLKDVRVSDIASGDKEEAKKPRSPLVRMKRVTSEGTGMISIPALPVSDSGSKLGEATAVEGEGSGGGNSGGGDSYKSPSFVLGSVGKDSSSASGKGGGEEEQSLHLPARDGKDGSSTSDKGEGEGEEQSLVLPARDGKDDGNSTSDKAEQQGNKDTSTASEITIKVIGTR